MIKSQSYNAYKKAGALSIPLREQMDVFIKGLPDGEYTFTIASKKRKRSLKQNAYYWGVIIPMVASIEGWEKYEFSQIHDGFKDLFLTDRTGKFPIVGSTSRMQPSEFGEYLDQVIIYCAQVLHIVIPPADPGWKEKL